MKYKLVGTLLFAASKAGENKRLLLKPPVCVVWWRQPELTRGNLEHSRFCGKVYIYF